MNRGRGHISKEGHGMFKTTIPISELSNSATEKQRSSEIKSSVNPLHLNKPNPSPRISSEHTMQSHAISRLKGAYLVFSINNCLAEIQ